MHWMPNPLAALTVAAAVAVAPVAVAQETVKFTLNVQKAGDPIEAAVVEVVNNDDPNVKLSRVTDYAGRVDFDVPRGAYTYRVITEGSEPVIGTVELNRPQDTTTRFTGPEREVDFTWSDFNVVASGDVLLFPSTTETLGFAALESFASGVPVVAANAGGLPFVIDDGNTGILVDPDSPDAVWAEEIVRVLRDDATHDRLAAAARAEAKRWTWRASSEQVVTYYEEVIRNAKR